MDLAMKKDRRSTGLSISTLSSSSTSSSPVVVSSVDDAEKGQFLMLPPRLENTGLPSPYLKAAAQEAARRPWHRRLAGSITRTKIFFVAVCLTLLLHRCIVTMTVVSYHKHIPKHEDLPPVSSPRVVTVSEQYRRKSWTISIPEAAGFPLRPEQYRDICSTARSMSSSLRRTSSTSASYYSKDPTFLDVLDAERMGVLNNVASQPPIPVVGYEARTEDNPAICARSLTYIMETEDAGLGKSLLSLWLAYGLAKREKRAFFIADSNWQYGSYLTYFKPPPMPSCSPPPASAVVPCPHQAAHLAVSAANVDEVFGAKFNDYFSSSSPFKFFNPDPIFTMVRAGYNALFALIGEDDTFATARIAELRSHATDTQHPVIGMHIRRGDRHPFEFEFSNDYLPLERFTTAALSVLPTSFQAKNSRNASEPVSLLVASDDPDIIASPDLLNPSTARSSTLPPFRLERAQDRIVLASKRTLEPTAPAPDDGGAFFKHVDEATGWEGGFFAQLFRGLGRDHASHYPSFASAAEFRTEVEERLSRHRSGDESQSEEEKTADRNARALKELVGRGYLLDLAVMGQADGVVCAVSSATCRVLAVMMGERKVDAGKWINVDDGRGWSWDGLH